MASSSSASSSRKASARLRSGKDNSGPGPPAAAAGRRPCGNRTERTRQTAGRIRGVASSASRWHRTRYAPDLGTSERTRDQEQRMRRIRRVTNNAIQHSHTIGRVQGRIHQRAIKGQLLHTGRRRV